MIIYWQNGFVDTIAKYRDRIPSPDYSIQGSLTVFFCKSCRLLWNRSICWYHWHTHIDIDNLSNQWFTFHIYHCLYAIFSHSKHKQNNIIHVWVVRLQWILVQNASLSTHYEYCSASHGILIIKDDLLKRQQQPCLSVTLKISIHGYSRFFRCQLCLWYEFCEAPFDSLSLSFSTILVIL